MSERECCSIAELQKKIHDTYALFSNLSVFCTKLERSLQSALMQIAEKPSSSCLKSQESLSKQQIDTLKSEFSSFSKENISLKELVYSLRDDIKRCQLFLETQVKKNSSLSQDLQEVTQRLKNAINDLDDNMHATVRKAKEEVSKRIDSLPIPNDSVNMEQVQKEILVKLEPVSLDAKNSLLTSRNHDLRLGILERKIENALLQLKNLELRNQ